MTQTDPHVSRALQRIAPSQTTAMTDRATALTWAMDLTPLVRDPKLSVEKYTLGYLDRLRGDVTARLQRFK